MDDSSGDGICKNLSGDANKEAMSVEGNIANKNLQVSSGQQK